MIRIEDRLARLIATLALGAAAGCIQKGGGGDTGTTTDTDTTDTDAPDLSGICAGDPPPTDYELNFGFVTVPPGTPCPDPADAQLDINSCTFLEWQGITCGLDHTDANQVYVNDGYGGHFVDADGAPTTMYGYPVGDPVDVCWYEAVFYLDPDHPTCGRPLLDGGHAVLADVTAESAWCGSTPSDADDRDADCAAWWTRAALLEHASVASFARFSLDLMRFGAPPDLVAGAHRAALDEIAHARLCADLASRFAGSNVGPGALPSTGQAAETLGDLAAALVREGCVGETLSAVDAAARLGLATDPAVREALAVIARDEADHAALAWRTLRWILEVDPSLGGRVAATFADERERWARAPAGPSTSERARARGLADGITLRRALSRGWDDVVAPSWSALAPGPSAEAALPG